jgi:hypothetical protein
VNKNELSANAAGNVSLDAGKIAGAVLGRMDLTFRKAVPAQPLYEHATRISLALCFRSSVSVDTRKEPGIDGPA